MGHNAYTGGLMNELSDVSRIKDKIYVIRGIQVMLDSDLASIYGYDVRSFNQQVRRNITRFPSDFMFELTKQEISLVKLQIVISRKTNYFSGQEGGRRKAPLAFTEQGIYMLASVLRGELAEQQSIFIMRSFKAMRDYLADNAMVFQRLDRIELKQLDTDNKVNQLFKQLEAPKQDKAVIFFKGQMWDATNCIEEIISKAEMSIILIDGYVDRNTLAMLTGKKTGVAVTIYTSERNCKITEKEKLSFTEQYGPLNIRFTDEFHDRFIILDQKEMYHIGASIKDAGKKAFEISINEDKRLLDAVLQFLFLYCCGRV